MIFRSILALQLVAIAGCIPELLAQSAKPASVDPAALPPRDAFVKVKLAWACPTREAAEKNTECAGGRSYGFNDLLKISGAPAGGVVRAQWTDETSYRDGFIAASAVGELPDMTSTERALADLRQRFPPEKQIPNQNMNYADLLTKRKSFAGKPATFSIRFSDMQDLHVHNGMLSFTMPTPMRANSRRMATVAFELKNSGWAQSFSNKGSYVCGPDFCDQFVVLAKLTERSNEHVDSTGTLLHVPVFMITEMTDRFGSYRGE